MTEKQEKILNAALELFAEEGFKSTSTSKVAKRAGVSEGLIFRHFENKEGLLSAIMKMGEEKARSLFSDIVTDPDPKSVIRKSIELGLKTSKNQGESDFWKLQFKIKWELEEYGAHKMEGLRNALEHAFGLLGFKNPEQETQAILAVMDGMATRYFLDETFDLEALVDHLKLRYNV